MALLDIRQLDVAINGVPILDSIGVSLDAVNRDVNGCFFYSQNGAVFVVNDDFGKPICLP